MTTGLVISPDNYISEAAVLARWPMLTAKELKRARRKNLITFYNFRGGVHYTAEQVQDYIDATYLKGKQCSDQPSHGTNKEPPPPHLQMPKSDSKSAGIISTDHTATAAPSSMPAGMTPELVASAVEVLKQRIGPKRKLNSRPSSSRHPPPPAQQFPVLIKS
jgi:hypothetical protein